MSGFWPKKVKAVLSNVALIILGIVLTFVVFEIVFRAAGAVYLALAQQRNRQALAQQDTIRILCLGESTTQIGGENSYPRQLERILNDSQNKTKFAVINGGVSGSNTTAIALHLSENLKLYQPRIVVLMMGINDSSVSVDGQSLRVLKTTNPLIKLLEKSRLVRLFRGLWGARQIHLVTPDRYIGGQEYIAPEPQDQNLLTYAMTATARRKYDQALAIYQQLIDRNKKYGYWPNGWFYRKMGWIYNNNGRHLEYLATITEILQLNAQDAWAHDRVLELCRERTDDVLVLDALRFCIKQHPSEGGLYQLMGSCFIERGQSQNADVYFEQERKLRRGGVNPVTRENYRQVLEALNAQNITVVVVQYPVRTFEDLAMTLEGLNAADHVIQVDNEKVFKDAIAAGRYEDYFIDRFAGDFGHCTTKGNHVLAQNIAHTILDKIVSASY
ncbi:MAG: hypothetical protein H6753_02755 [Candidatus Omnitrophica bacterium]|nr:hypothetical protein [Candidatus Omnitrophota bacterium]